jgi:hypothetical protein
MATATKVKPKSKTKTKPAAKRATAPARKPKRAKATRQTLERIATQRDEAYSRHRDAAAVRAREQSSQTRDIGPIPAIVDPDRRAECEQDLQLALETYFPDVFALGWSHQHIAVIDALQTTLRDGGLFALGMPRGSGKTSLCVHAGLLAMLYGWRKFLVLIGATAGAAYEMLDVLRLQIESNDLLLEDFPEICYPVRCLEGISQRAKGQTVGGEPTRIQWSGRKEIVLPTVHQATGSSGIVRAVGLLGRVRGMLFLTPEGKIERPDVFLGDDLQTDQSAKNPVQVERRETLLNGAVLGLCGPGKRMAGLATVTIVRKGDLADRLLDRQLNPQWHGKTFALVEQWPNQTATEHWEHYAELREIDLAAGEDLLPRATKYYRQNRDVMEAGAVVPWAQRREPHELSALQNAYNLKLSKPATFDAEYQNNPQASNLAAGSIAIESDLVVARVNGYARGEIARAASHLFCGIDVQQDVLFWMVAALADDFTGWIVDYGPWPAQPLGNYWTLRELAITLKAHTGAKDLEGSLYAGLNGVLNHLAGRRWQRDDGAAMALDRIVIDANWGPSTSTVYDVCRTSVYQPLPFHGKGITAKQSPMATRKRKAGERTGEYWYMPAVRGTNTPRHIIADTNSIKTLLAQRLCQPIGSRGAWSLYQHSIAGHRMLADHFSAEIPIETEGRGRKLYEWTLLPGRDNHWLDCAGMITTAALMAGCKPGLVASTQRQAHSGQSLAEMRKAALAKRRH